MLDALLDRPLEQVLSQMPLSADLELALLEGGGDLGGVLYTVKAYDNGRFEEMPAIGLESADMRAVYLEALEWSDMARHSMLSVR